MAERVKDISAASAVKTPQESAISHKQNEKGSVKTSLVAGAGITAVVTIGLAAAWGQTRGEEGSQEPTRTPETTVVRTLEAMPSWTATTKGETPEASATSEPSVEPGVDIKIDDISRDNYLRFFETSRYSFKDKVIVMEPLDESNDFLRTFNNYDSDGRPFRMGVIVEKIDNESGIVVDEITDFSELFVNMGEIKDEKDALAVVMAQDQEVTGYISRSVSGNTLETVTVGALVDRGSECLIASFEVKRVTGEVTRVASQVGQQAEGECGE